MSIYFVSDWVHVCVFGGTRIGEENRSTIITSYANKTIPGA